MRKGWGVWHSDKRGWGCGPFPFGTNIGIGIATGGFSGRRGSRFFGFGEIRLAILSLLEAGPKHGYQLMRELEERSGGIYQASAGSVYPTLQMLEDEGLVEVEHQNGRKTYRLTEAGRKELEREAETVRNIWNRAEQCADWSEYLGPEVAMIAGPMAVLIKSLLRASRRAHGQPELEDRVREIVRRTCRELDDVAPDSETRK